MGTIAGSETFGIGVAPHVQWIAAKGCRDGSCLDYGLMASAEWVMVCHPCAGVPCAPMPVRALAVGALTPHP